MTQAVHSYNRYLCAKRMQMALQAAGLYKGAIDGKWGPKSCDAYNRFQPGRQSMGWDMFRPLVFSYIRHAAVTGAAVLAARYGIQVDDATINGVSNLALNGVDVAVAAASGAVGSLASNFGKIKALVKR